jgi:molybdopterin molybdotransferase
VSELLGLEEAQARILALAPLLPREAVLLAAMNGRYLAADIRAARTQPAADLSAMDGYALAPDAGPWTLVGESRAGAPFAGALAPGECARISTGASVPKGADRVLLQEGALRDGSTITATDDPPPGRHIRPRGFDFRTGDLLLTRGTLMTPARIALALAAGHAKAMAARPLRVVVMDCGDELVADPADCAPHQLPASNAAMLAAMLAPLGCAVTRIGPVPDDATALAAALAQAEGADLLITSGGASVGDHDLIKPALADWGAETAFWKVAIKPGKPLLVATRGAQVVLGLPGNPVSSFVTAFLFALPLVRAAMGTADPLPLTRTLVTAEPLPGVGKRREFLRAVRDGDMARLAGSQDSSALSALALADCLIDRPANAPPLTPGSPVTVYPLQNG